MRTVLTDHGFTISVLIAVGMTAVFSFAFEADEDLVGAMLALGIFTAVIEFAVRPTSVLPD